MDDDTDSGGDSLDTEDFGYGDDSDAADTGSSYADYDGEGDGDDAYGLMGDGAGDDEQGSSDGYQWDLSQSGNETDGLNAQDYGSDDGQAMGKPIDPCKGYRAICQKHPAWAGECRDTVDKAQADADAHNKTYHGGTPWAGVLD
jgi:hypothetical protein